MSESILKLNEQSVCKVIDPVPCFGYSSLDRVAAYSISHIVIFCPDPIIEN